MKQPLLLCILDGVGMRKETEGNAFAQAQMPHFDALWNQYPHCYLKASGEAVGLPSGQMGNSEVGHMNIGAGRIVYQPLQFINEQIKAGTFFKNAPLCDLINRTKQKGTTLHIMGLLSDGGIHSHITQLMAVIDLCQKLDMKDVLFHIFTDGRDTLPTSSITYLDALQSKLEEVGFGEIATVSGRYYAMDRDNRWDRIEKAYQTITHGTGEKYASYQEGIQHNYEKGITDEFIVPFSLKEAPIKEGDGILCFNYRPDRLRELFSALTNPSFASFQRDYIPDLSLVTLMPVSKEVLGQNAFDLPILNNTLGEYLDSLGYSQLRIAETEKYAHVTYFFDGGEEKEFVHGKRILIPSPKVATYDLAPLMSAAEITEELLKELDQDYDFIVLNFANGDMLGHTGNIPATIEGLEFVDQCLGKIKNKIAEKKGRLIVTADHGNCELMRDEEGNVITSHTTSLVPFLVTDASIRLKDGKLGDIAPTILTWMGLPIPKEMTGISLID